MAEQSDVHTRIIVWLALGLLLTVIVISAGLWFSFTDYFKPVTKADRPLSDYPIPPQPRLQADPRADLRALKAEKRALLEGYHWVDRDAGTVRIPIDRAMALIATGQTTSAGPADE